MSWLKKITLALGLISNLTVVLHAKEFQRIVALSPHAVELLYSIGLGDKIIATVESADFPEAASKIPRIGNYTGIQIEKLLALNPDLVVAWKSGNKSSDLAKLESLGLNIVYSDPQNIAEVFSDLRELGELTGHREEAEILIDHLVKRYQSIKAKFKHRSKVTVFYQLWHDPLTTIGPASSIDSLIADCGGENVFNHVSAPYPIVSLESVLVKNPKVIIIPHHSGSEIEKQQGWSKWPEISAVKNNKIFILNGDLIHRFTPRTLDGLELLCMTIDQGRLADSL